MSDEQRMQAAGDDALQADQVPEFASPASGDLMQPGNDEAQPAIGPALEVEAVEITTISEVTFETPEPEAPAEPPAVAKRPKPSPRKSKRKKAKAMKAKAAKSKKAKAKTKRKTVKRAKPARKTTKRKKATRTKKSAKRVKKPAKSLKKPAKRAKKARRHK